MKAKRVLAAIAALTAALTVTAAPFASVSAATENTSKSDTKKDDTKVIISGLKKPVQGRNFDHDMTAEYKGVKWTLKVNWMDKKNKPAIKAEAGNSYRPFITFWVPAELDAVEVFTALGTDGYYPDFLKNPLVIKENYSDKEGTISGQIWYITADPIKVERTSAGSAGAAEGSGGGGTAPASASSSDNSSTDSDSGSGSGSGSAGSVTGGTSDSGTNTADSQDEYQEEDLGEISGLSHMPLRAFCLNDEQYEELVNEYGEDLLQALVDEIRFILEPQAVNILSQKVWSFGDGVENGEISTQIGFFLDTNPGICGVAIIDVEYNDEEDRYNFFHSYGISPSAIFGLNEDGQYELSEYGRVIMENTLTHELTHAFMQDYNRTGMIGSNELAFPKWFSEGVASTCDDNFGFRRMAYFDFAGTKFETGDDGEYAVEFSLGDPELLMNNYTARNWTLTDTQSHDGKNCYVTGYLACLYLYALADARLDENLNFEGYYTGAPETFDSDTYAHSLGDILFLLHFGVPLDTIIAAISPVDENGDPIYGSTAEFESKFMTEADGGLSAAFCAALLEYLGNANPQGDTAGSILRPFDMSDTAFLGNSEAYAPVFRITGYDQQDGTNFVLSDVEDTWIGAGTSMPNIDEVEEGEPSKPEANTVLAAKVG